MKIEIFDSTLRDGAQGEGISYTLHDKRIIAQKLDKLAVDYIEAGNPASNPKDMEFFEQAPSLGLSHAQLVAFGSTRRKDTPARDDAGLQALLRANTGIVAVFGKANIMQVTEVLDTSPDHNLEMIYDTVRFLRENGKRVFFDAEHFFDGYKNDAEYALSCLEAARSAGAGTLVLCDTNGAAFPDEVAEIAAAVVSVTDGAVGIHCHNDMGCAVANSILAVKAGCVQVQGTLIGTGERCGNTNLAALLPSLQLKLGYDCIPPDRMARLTQSARFVAEVSNLPLGKTMPYVGGAAFAHKGGMHVDGVRKNSASFEHIAPEAVGNRRNILISEVSGRAAMLSVIREVDPAAQKDSPETRELTGLLKSLENRGYLFESASASLELLITKKLGRFEPLFRLVRFKVIGEQEENGRAGFSTAMIHIRARGEEEIAAAEGEGPVHALDLALKKAVARFYPSVKRIRLTDYKVRVMDPTEATAATVRVLLSSTEGGDVWTTVGVSRDIIEASLAALLDSIEYRLLKFPPER